MLLRGATEDEIGPPIQKVDACLRSIGVDLSRAFYCPHVSGEESAYKPLLGRICNHIHPQCLPGETPPTTSTGLFIMSCHGLSRLCYVNATDIYALAHEKAQTPLFQNLRQLHMAYHCRLHDKPLSISRRHHAHSRL